MIKSNTPFLTFNGNCSEAHEYYTKVFGAVIGEKTTFKDAGETGDEAYLAQIAFSTVTIGNSVFYAGDVVNPTLRFKAEDQNQVSFWLEIDTVDSLRTLESTLVESGASNISPIEETFWGAMYFKAQDQFGINWEFNTQLDS